MLVCHWDDLVLHNNFHAEAACACVASWCTPAYSAGCEAPSAGCWWFATPTSWSRPVVTCYQQICTGKQADMGSRHKGRGSFSRDCICAALCSRRSDHTCGHAWCCGPAVNPHPTVACHRRAL